MGEHSTMLLSVLGVVVVSIVSQDSKVVYGTDDRLEYYQAPSALRSITRKSIVALMDSSTLGEPNSQGIYTDYKDASSLASLYSLCDGEAFSSQPTAAYCSGTLIAPNLVVTAGHCLESNLDCLSMRLVFDYYYTSDGELADVTTDSVYNCVDYIRELSETDTKKRDYAVIRLDRDVTGDREPVEVSDSGSDVSVNDLYDMIGFPSGLPAKILSNFPLRAVDATKGTFLGSPDTFAGNSGSGVFDSNGLHVGILVEGETDYVDTAGGCAVVNDCGQDECSGETSTLTYIAVKALSDIECSRDSQCVDDTCGEGYCWGGKKDDNSSNSITISVSLLLASLVLAFSQ
eukprot:c5646_g1_i1.p1 GENE.c5646_g1_i1~~c5646_g1_i1.p1  ORF type:complete len:345 (-),score=69.26 c5646_g1_i1:25-1059(-)